MNIKLILTITLPLLMLVLLVAPAMAAPAQQIEFIAKTIPLNPQPPQEEDYVKFTTNGDIIHCRNQIGASTVKLWLGTDALGTPNYQGKGSSVVMWTLNQERVGPTKYEMTWTFTGGTFEGNIIGSMTAVSPTAPSILTDLHGVLHGTGIFEGQIMRLEEGSRPAGQPATYTGTIITP